MNIFEAIAVAIVEGLTEFLPVSSTGHMIILSSLLGIHKEEFTKLFEVAIQLGAILAVVVLYWKKFIDFKSWAFYVKLAIAVIPALVLGFLFSNQIDALLESPLTVAITLLLGGIILIFIDRAFQRPATNEEKEISSGKAFVIGCWQCLAMIPGVSRSAASIIGGMQQKLTRSLAAEFSFFLAVPTMAAATGYSLVIKKWPNPAGGVQKGYELLMNSRENLIAFITGNIVAFVVALLAIKFFIGFLQKHGFKWFGYYRIVAGLILLILLFTNVIHN
ncbi:undecaprenyl-diphosphate phosphatase [Flavihumibacter profundi]|uniref:undecaprenyl-diphosphate phosphatase n=1 Tax=Flavihumibacter profundi TaxID=2716883 RepID=UPI001CC6DFF7|nr:undecaprenyl-diphosphate phosphatase [Flavihumibacter profundi]MBZ5858121.1 undecaprenyl-diphosphate phosphatase [Flavihumibacter profundi]